MRKISLLFLWCIMLLYGITEANVYTDTAGDHLWTTAANWAEGIPVKGVSLKEWAEMTIDNTILLIQEGMDCQASGLQVGVYGGDNDFFMSGGILNVDHLNIGRGGNSLSDEGTFGYMEITGGEITCGGIKIPEQFGEPGVALVAGRLAVKGGTIINNGYFGIGNGEMTYGNDFNSGGDGRINVAGGTMKWLNNRIATIQHYIALERIRFYDAEPNTVDERYYNLIYDPASNYTNLPAVDPNTINRSLAWRPNPADNAVVNPALITLSWMPGDNAKAHHLYLGTDYGSVLNAVNPNVAPGQGVLVDLNKTFVIDQACDTSYYWRIDEVINGSPVKGIVWKFTTTDNYMIDTFEGEPNDIIPPADPNHPFPNWPDSGNIKKYAEQTTKYDVYAMKLTCGIGQSGSVSTLPWSSDWEQTCLGGLQISFYGNAANSTDAQFSVKVNNSNPVFCSKPINLPAWNTFIVKLADLAAAGVDLDHITSLSLILNGGTVGAEIIVDNVMLIPYTCISKPQADLSNDCVVTMADLELLSSYWLIDGTGDLVLP